MYALAIFALNSKSRLTFPSRARVCLRWNSLLSHPIAVQHLPGIKAPFPHVWGIMWYYIISAHLKALRRSCDFAFSSSSSLQPHTAFLTPVCMHPTVVTADLKRRRLSHVHFIWRQRAWSNNKTTVSCSVSLQWNYICALLSCICRLFLLFYLLSIPSFRSLWKPFWRSLCFPCSHFVLIMVYKGEEMNRDPILKAASSEAQPPTPSYEERVVFFKNEFCLISSVGQK